MHGMTLPPKLLLLFSHIFMSEFDCLYIGTKNPQASPVHPLLSQPYRVFEDDYQSLVISLHEWASLSKFLPDGKGRDGRPVEDDIRKLVALETEAPSGWLEQRLGLWHLCEVEERFWKSLKETSPVFFRVALLVLGQISSSGFAERVISTRKLVQDLNHGTMDLETFDNLVVL